MNNILSFIPSFLTWTEPLNTLKNQIDIENELPYYLEPGEDLSDFLEYNSSFPVEKKLVYDENNFIVGHNNFINHHRRSWAGIGASLIQTPSFTTSPTPSLGDSTDREDSLAHSRLILLHYKNKINVLERKNSLLQDCVGQSLHELEVERTARQVAEKTHQDFKKEVSHILKENSSTIDYLEGELYKLRESIESPDNSLVSTSFSSTKLYFNSFNDLSSLESELDSSEVLEDVVEGINDLDILFERDFNQHVDENHSIGSDSDSADSSDSLSQEEYDSDSSDSSESLSQTESDYESSDFELEQADISLIGIETGIFIQTHDLSDSGDSTVTPTSEETFTNNETLAAEIRNALFGEFKATSYASDELSEEEMTAMEKAMLGTDDRFNEEEKEFKASVDLNPDFFPSHIRSLISQKLPISAIIADIETFDFKDTSDLTFKKLTTLVESAFTYYDHNTTLIYDSTDDFKSTWIQVVSYFTRSCQEKQILINQLKEFSSSLVRQALCLSLILGLYAFAVIDDHDIITWGQSFGELPIANSQEKLSTMASMSDLHSRCRWLIQRSEQIIHIEHQLEPTSSFLPTLHYSETQALSVSYHFFQPELTRSQALQIPPKKPTRSVSFASQLTKVME